MLNKLKNIYYYMISNINLVAILMLSLCLCISYNLVLLNSFNFIILLLYGLIIELAINYITIIYKKINFFLKKTLEKLYLFKNKYIFIYKSKKKIKMQQINNTLLYSLTNNSNFSLNESLYLEKQYEHNFSISNKQAALNRIVYVNSNIV